MNEKSGSLKAETARAFRAHVRPVARLMVRALAVPDAALAGVLGQVRGQMADWLAMLNRPSDFTAAFEALLMESLALGLTSGQAVKASLEDVLERAGRRVLLPTSLGSAELREMSADVREASLFSARTTCAEYLAAQARVIEDFLAGRINTATARLRLVQELDRLGYDPEEGFGDGALIPPAEAGSLQDLSSDRRIQLILDTQAELAFGKGQEIAGMETFETFPCWELVRLSPRLAKRAWLDRWEEVGGETYGPDNDRMIARKDSGIWRMLGHHFRDSLRTSHPPFAFNSGMGWVDVNWVEAVELGAVDAGWADAAGEPAIVVSRNLDRPPVPTDLPADLGAQLRADLARLTAESERLARRDIDNANRSYAAR